MAELDEPTIGTCVICSGDLKRNPGPTPFSYDGCHCTQCGLRYQFPPPVGIGRVSIGLVRSTMDPIPEEPDIADDEPEPPGNFLRRDPIEEPGMGGTIGLH